MYETKPLMYEMREYREPRYVTKMRQSLSYGRSSTSESKVSVRSTPY